MHKNANYRKLNDGSHNSGTYHKKDGTPVRQILKRALLAELADAEDSKSSSERSPGSSPGEGTI